MRQANRLKDKSQPPRTLKVVVLGAQQVGEVFRQRRRALKLSQRAVAAQLGVSQSRFSILEQNPATMPLQRLLALTNLLGLQLVLQDASSPTGEW
jgi:HTH-type transcriptional regulator / antitoxin HipB